MAIAQAGSRMFELGPEKSLAWLQSCPEDVKAPAIAGLFSEWYDNDRQTLKTWLDSAGPGRDQDLAREVVVGKLLNSDLVEAQNIAATIGDSATRDRVMKSVTRRVKAALPKN